MICTTSCAPPSAAERLSGHAPAVTDVAMPASAYAANVSGSPRNLAVLATSRTTLTVAWESPGEDGNSSVALYHVSIDDGVKSFNAGEEFAGSMGFLQTTLGKTAEAAEQLPEQRSNVKY